VIQTLHGGFLSHGGTHLYHPFLFGIFHETNHPTTGIHSPGQSYRVLPHWASAAAWGRAARQRGSAEQRAVELISGANKPSVRKQWPT